MFKRAMMLTRRTGVLAEFAPTSLISKTGSMRNVPRAGLTAQLSTRGFPPRGRSYRGRYADDGVVGDEHCQAMSSTASNDHRVNSTAQQTTEPGRKHAPDRRLQLYQ